jgi:hypothetical protein
MGYERGAALLRAFSSFSFVELSVKGFQVMLQGKRLLSQTRLPDPEFAQGYARFAGPAGFFIAHKK